MRAVDARGLCVLHGLILDGQKRMQRSAQRASSHGDFLMGAVFRVGPFLLDRFSPALTETFNRAIEDPMATAQKAAAAARFARQAVRPPPPPPPLKKDPFEILGLDPKTATAADVRKMQKKLAQIYHPDRGGAAAAVAAAETKLKEINEAATDCLKRTKR